MSDKFAVGLVQMRCTTNKEENLTRAAEKIREAAARGAQVICLHELFAGEYFCRTEDPELFNLAEAVPGPTTGRLAAASSPGNPFCAITSMARVIGMCTTPAF